MRVSMEWTLTYRQVLTEKKALRYRSADRSGKFRILTEVVELTGAGHLGMGQW